MLVNKTCASQHHEAATTLACALYQLKLRLPMLSLTCGWHNTRAAQPADALRRELDEDSVSSMTSKGGWDCMCYDTEMRHRRQKQTSTSEQRPVQKALCVATSQDEENNVRSHTDAVSALLCVVQPGGWRQVRAWRVCSFHRPPVLIRLLNVHTSRHGKATKGARVSMRVGTPAHYVVRYPHHSPA